MLFPAERFNNSPVMSLQTGSELARTARAIIDPNTLSVIAYELEGRLLDQNPSLLRVADIREIGPLGMIIDSVDELISLGDVINIKKVYELNFSLAGLKVIDEKKRNVGRVASYTLEPGNFVIQQLVVKRPLFKSFGDTELLIHRSQIIKITDETVIVKAPTIRHQEPVAQSARQTFENPFRRSPQPNTEASDI